MIKDIENDMLSVSQQETFTKWFPNTKIKNISGGHVPANVFNALEFGSQVFLNLRDYQPLQFSALYQITFCDGSLAYAAKNEPKELTFHKEESIHLINSTIDGTIQGYSEMAFAINSSDRRHINKPYQRESGTNYLFRRQGLSIRRTITLNAMSQMLYNLPLYSSTNFLITKDLENNKVKAQKLVWEKLVRFNLAQKYMEGDQERFVFVSEL